MSDFEGRIALITGASRGIGRAVAIGLAKAGAHVILVAREKSIGALEEVDDEIQAAGGAATLVPMDLADGEAIDRLGAALFERWGKLDILVGNAGLLGQLGPLHHMPPKEFEELVAVNLTANWRLIRSCDALLRASDAGRAVFVTSGAARNTRAYWGPYGATKAALEQMVSAYAQETQETTNIRINLITPGPMRTAMRKKAMPGEDESTLPLPEDIVPLFLDLLSPAQQRTGEVVRFTQTPRMPA